MGNIQIRSGNCLVNPSLEVKPVKKAAPWWSWALALAAFTGVLWEAAGFSHHPWFWGLGLGIGWLASSLVMTFYLERRGHPAPAKFQTWDLLASLPLLAIPLLSLMVHRFHFSNPPLNLAVAGAIRFPWMPSLRGLEFSQYLLLLALGAAWVVAGILRLAVWLAHWTRIRNFADERQSALPLLLTAWFAGLWLQGWPAVVYPPTGDEVHYLLMSKRWLAAGDFDLKTMFAQKAWKADYPAETLDFHGRPDAKGRWIGRHLPAISVFMAPAYRWAGRWGASAVCLFFSALAAWLLYGLARDLGAAPPAAFRVYALALVTAPLSVYGYLLYPVAPAMAVLTAACRLFLRKQGRLSSAGLGMMAGCLPWLHLSLAAVFGVLMLAATLKCLREKALDALPWLWMPALAWMLPFGWIYLNFYQSATASGDYQFGFWPGYAFSAFLGLLADRDYGIFISAPVYLAAFAGLAWLRKRGKKEASILLLGIWSASVLLAVLFNDWTGFSASFARLIAPASFPLLAALPAFWQSRPDLWVWTRVLAGWGVLVSLSTWILPPLLYELPKGRILAWLTGKGMPVFWTVAPRLTHHPGVPALLHGAAWVILAGIIIWTLANHPGEAKKV